jgi:hypothetical protein
MNNKMHVYDQKQSDYIGKNLKLEDFEEMDPAYLNPQLREIYQKLQTEAKPKEPASDINQPTDYEPAADLFAS